MKILWLWLFFALLVALGGTSILRLRLRLRHFLQLSGTSSILRTFRGGTSWKKHPVSFVTIMCHMSYVTPCHILFVTLCHLFYIVSPHQQVQAWTGVLLRQASVLGWTTRWLHRYTTSSWILGMLEISTIILVIKMPWLARFPNPLRQLGSLTTTCLARWRVWCWPGSGRNGRDCGVVKGCQILMTMEPLRVESDRHYE